MHLCGTVRKILCNKQWHEHEMKIQWWNVSIQPWFEFLQQNTGNFQFLQQKLPVGVVKCHQMLPLKFFRVSTSSSKESTQGSFELWFGVVRVVLTPSLGSSQDLHQWPSCSSQDLHHVVIRVISDTFSHPCHQQVLMMQDRHHTISYKLLYCYIFEVGWKNALHTISPSIV